MFAWLMGVCAKPKLANSNPQKTPIESNRFNMISPSVAARYFPLQGEQQPHHSSASGEFVADKKVTNS
jgi:hypothetical protein